MQLPDGREVLLRFAVPIPVTVVAELLPAIGRAVERLGYTDIRMGGDDDNVPCISALPPARPQMAAR